MPSDQDIFHAVAAVESGWRDDQPPEIQDKTIRRVDPENAPEEGSSAYGYLQVNRDRAADIANNLDPTAPDTKMLKDFHKDVLDPQYDNFLKYGREPYKEGYDPKWEYGAHGVFTPGSTDIQDRMFKKKLHMFQMHGLRQTINKHKNNDPNKSMTDILRSWHFGEKGMKDPKNDITDYRTKVFNELRNINPKYFQ